MNETTPTTSSRDGSPAMDASPVRATSRELDAKIERRRTVEWARGTHAQQPAYKVELTARHHLDKPAFMEGSDARDDARVPNTSRDRKGT